MYKESQLKPERTVANWQIKMTQPKTQVGQKRMPLIEYACHNIVSCPEGGFLVLSFAKYVIESRVESTTAYPDGYGRYGIPLHNGCALSQLRALDASTQMPLLSFAATQTAIVTMRHLMATSR